MTLEWPDGFERTLAEHRTRNKRFRTSLRDTIDQLEDELELIGADEWRLSTDARHQNQNPSYPYANQNPDDPGAVVRWTMENGQYAVACDAYTRLRDNIRTLYLYIHEKRKMSQRPVKTGQSEFASARLPSADDELAAPKEPPHEILDVAPDADPEIVEAAARQKKKACHPDVGGNREEFQRVLEAEEAMLDE
ncbi:J domain-containing protein [Halopiger thermotolerans]